MKELTTTFIDKDIFIKYGKRFLKSIIEELELKAKVDVDIVGTGCGPHLIIDHDNFILKIFGSSFGSGDRVGSCYVMVQPKCLNMNPPFDLGHVSHYSLAYYANNPKYLIDKLNKTINETTLWEVIKKQKIQDKWLHKPHKYLDKIEKAYNAITEHFLVLSHLDNKAKYYYNDLKTLVLKTQQEKIIKKETKCVDKNKYKNNCFVPYKNFKQFAEKHKAKIVGGGNKYFYSEKAGGLFFGVVDTYPYKFIKMKRKNYDKLKPKLKKYDSVTHKKLFDDAVQIYTPKTSLTFTGILKCLHTMT